MSLGSQWKSLHSSCCHGHVLRVLQKDVFIKLYAKEKEHEQDQRFPSSNLDVEGLLADQTTPSRVPEKARDHKVQNSGPT